MKIPKKPSRTPLLRTLQKAFYFNSYSQKPASPPPDELLDMTAVKSAERRRFIGNALKAGAVIGAAGLFDACRKVTDLVPGLQPKIVIVGAGMAGLNCAWQLKKMRLTSTVYEGSSRVGGRIFSKTNLLAPGLYTELGGEFIDSDHEDMLNLCAEFGLNLLDTITPEESQFARDTFYIDGKFYTETEVIAAFQPYAERIAADIDSLPDEISYDSYNQSAFQFDHMSLSAYLDSIGMSGFIRKGIETAYLTEYGLETDLQSSINFLFLFSPDTSEGFDIFGSSDERYKIVGGNQSLTNALYQQVKGQVYTEHQLVKIEENFSGYSLYFSNANGTTIKTNADIVVLTTPFSTLRKVKLNVSLPSWKVNAIQNLGYGTNAKLLMGFDSRVWRNYQHSGYTFSNLEIENGWDNSWAQPGNKGGYTIFQGGNKGVELGNGTPESQAPKFLMQLEQMWPGTRAAFNGKVARMHWPTYPFTLGSYACYKVGQYTSITGSEIKPVGNIYFAGEHCSSDFQGYMNGAAQTGRFAAEAIKNAVKSGKHLIDSPSLSQ